MYCLFFEGLRRLQGNFDLFHSHFYESKSFELALDNLTRVNYENTYIYIACHGKGKRLHKMNLRNALEKINHKAQSHNIVGVVIGSCLVGNNTDIFSEFMRGSSITWKFGYKCSVNWFDGTMLDLSIFRNTLDLEEAELQNDSDILYRFKLATGNLAPSGSIGWKDVKEDREYTDDDRVDISESLSLVIQSRGQGKKPQDFSDLLFEYDEPDESVD